MSEVLTVYKNEKQQWAKKLHSEPFLRYARQQASQQYEFLICMEMPWPLLRLKVDLLDSDPVELNYIDRLKILTFNLRSSLFFYFRGYNLRHCKDITSTCCTSEISKHSCCSCSLSLLLSQILHVF